MLLFDSRPRRSRATPRPWPNLNRCDGPRRFRSASTRARRWPKRRKACFNDLGGSPDVAFLFVSSHHASAYGAIPAGSRRSCHRAICSAVPPAASSAPGAKSSAARRSASSPRACRVWNFSRFMWGAIRAPPTPAFWSELTGIDPATAAGFVLMVDPLSIDSEPLLRGPRCHVPERAQDRRPHQRRPSAGRGRAVLERPHASQRRARPGVARARRAADRRGAGLPSDRRADDHHAHARVGRLRAERRQTGRRAAKAVRAARAARPGVVPALAVSRHRDERPFAQLRPGRFSRAHVGRARAEQRRDGGAGPDQQLPSRAVPLCATRARPRKTSSYAWPSCSARARPRARAAR